METGHILQRKEFQKDDRLVLVKMVASPVNPADLNAIQGTYPLENPLGIGGNEGFGIIEKVGPNSKLKPGDWVIPGKPAFGTWREQIVCAEDDLQQIPSDLPSSVASTLIVNPPTAYRLLSDFINLKAGDVIIQNGANSAVGRYIIQLAHHRGIKTINIIRDRSNYELLEKELLSLGATTVVKSHLFSTEQVQSYLCSTVGKPVLGLNCIGGVATAEMSRILASSGTIVTYGGMSGKNPVISASSMIFRDIQYRGFWMSNWYQQPQNMGKARQQMFEEIISLFKQKILSPPKLEHFEFNDWKAAMDRYSHDSVIRSSDSKPLLIFSKGSL